MKRVVLVLSLIAILCFSISCSHNKGVAGASSHAGASASAPSASPSELAGQLVASMIAGDFTSAVKDFSKTMQEEMPAETLRAIWTSFCSRSGYFKERVGIRTQTIGQIAGVFVKCRFGSGDFDIVVSFNSQREVVSLRFVTTDPTSKYEPLK